MRSFSELLTEYTARTGISDAELARALGVRRQTVFRWKEGLTERPRHREDVARCADKLRLTPDERDELLLAAGFAPERPPAPVGAGRVEPVSDGEPDDGAAVPAAGVAHRELVGTVAPTGPAGGRERRHLLRVGAPLVVLAGLVTVLYALAGPAAGPPRPLAAPGETLIVVGPFDGANGPVRAAIERETRAARLENVRLEPWPEPIADQASTARARRSSGARVAVGGSREGGDARVELSFAPPRSRQTELALAALVVDPAESAFPIDAGSVDEARALAVLVLAELLVDQGDAERAAALLTGALANPPAAPEAAAALYLAAGRAAQLGSGVDAETAVERYDRSIAAADGWIARQNRGVASLRLDRPAGWRGDLARAAELRPREPAVQRALCWGYTLDGDPGAALPYCDAAVAAEPEGRAREARAAAYAGVGRLADAAAELDRFLGWLENQPPALRARYGTSRAEWRQALREGRNPIDPAALERVRRE